jgi:hypothetical protein
MAKNMIFWNPIYLGQNLSGPVRGKIDDDSSETTKLLISSDRFMLRLEAKSHLIEICLLYIRLTNAKYKTVMTKTE